MPSTLAPSESFMTSFPSTISPYLRRISESGPFKQTASAVRFVRRFLGYNKADSQSNPDFTFTYRAPTQDGVRHRRGRTQTRRGSSPATLPSGSKIFTHGPLGPHDGGTAFEKRPPSKTLSTARDKLKETKKTRSSISKKAMKASRTERPRNTNPFAMEKFVSHLLDASNAMDVDSTSSPPEPRPRRPLTRSESMLSYSVTSGVTVTHNKRKSSSSDLVAHRLKRLRISVSFSSMTDDQLALPTVSQEAVLAWIRSQPTIRDLIAERLKAHFAPASLPTKVHDKRMKKLAEIVNSVGYVIPYKNSSGQSQHLIVLNDEFQRQMVHPLTGTPLFPYTGMVARIRLTRAMDSMRRKSEAQKLVECTPMRRMSPLVHEM